LAAAFLLGTLAALLAVNVWSSSRWGSRPTEHAGISVHYRVDLNRADRAELLQLPGVGEGLAERISAYRREHGGFQQVDELTQIHGVGPATLERLRPWVSALGSAKDVGGTPPGRIVRSEPTTSRKSARPTQDVGANKLAKLTGRININCASLEELQHLPGIGAKMAQRIIDERRHAPFRSVDDLRRVHGIGPKTLERLRPWVFVSDKAFQIAAADQS
jgi:competence protein ComEA